MDLLTLTNRLNKLGGFDLSKDEATSLLNEGLRDLAANSRFPRKVWQFDTQDGQALYDLPLDFVQPEWVQVGGRIYDAGTESDVARFAAGELALHAPGVWYVAGDRKQFGLWPVPGAEVQSVLAEYVFRPQALVLDSDEPTAIPEQFHPALIFYAATQYYGLVEDNVDLEVRNSERYDEQVARLRAFSIAQTGGNKPFRVGILGHTA